MRTVTESRIAEPVLGDALARLAALYPSLADRYCLAPTDPVLLIRVGRALVDAQDGTSAAAFLEWAVPLAPERPELSAAWADGLALCGRYDAAAAVLEHGMRRVPRDLHLPRKLAQVWHERLNRPDDAARLLASIVRATHQDADYLSLAHCFVNEQTAGRLAARLQDAAGPDAPRMTVLNATAECLLHAGRYEEAAGVSAHVLRHLGENVASLCTRGWALTLDGCAGEAATLFTRAVALDPNSWRAAWSRFCHLQMVGEYREAREVLVRARHLWSGSAVGPDTADEDKAPLWDGSPLAGRRICLHQEHYGFGDAVQYVRFASWLKDRGAHVTVVARQPVASLLAAADGIDAAVPRFETRDRADYAAGPAWPWVLLDVAMHELPGRVPYLRLPEDRVARWRQRLNGHGGLAVGFAWQGSDAHVRNPQGLWGVRSVPFLSLSPLLTLAGTRWYSLQQHGADHPDWHEFAAPAIVDVARDCANFAELAAAMAALDAVVTTDTAVAHIAGALGKRTWLMLPSAADWRWELGRADSLWYPSMRIVRQPWAGAWAPVVATVLAELRQFGAAREAPPTTV